MEKPSVACLREYCWREVIPPILGEASSFFCVTGSGIMPAVSIEMPDLVESAEVMAFGYSKF